MYINGHTSKDVVVVVVFVVVVVVMHSSRVI